jgi:two-component system LytT family response regulator
MNAIIFEDNPIDLLNLESLLSKYFPEITILGKADTVQSGMALLHTNKPDLVIADIQLPDGVSFDILNQLESFPFQLIVISAFDSYAMNAIKMGAIDYILKPATKVTLENAINKAKVHVDQKIRMEQMSMMLQTYYKGSPAQRIGLPNSEGLRFVKLDEILYCKAEGNYTYFYMLNNRKEIVSQTLKEVETKLAQYDNFLRIHKSFMVNLKYVADYKKGRGGQIILEDNSELEVAPDKKEALLKRLQGK